MPAEQPDPNPLEQLVELLVYAPVGLLYDYQDVIPKLVKRGKSQVQLARLLARMAANQARPGSSAPPRIDEVASVAWSVLARAITEIGANVGLAPPSSPPAPPPPAPPAPPPTPAPPAPQAPPADSAPSASPPEPSPSGLQPAGGQAATGSPSVGPPPAPVPAVAQSPGGGPLPIAGYDTLTAREIVGLLGDLSAGQRVRVRQHETANRGRKTILAKLDQLDHSDSPDQADASGQARG